MRPVAATAERGPAGSGQRRAQDNWRPLLKGAFRPEVGVELALPLYQKLNGIQAPQDWRLSSAIRQTF